MANVTENRISLEIDSADLATLQTAFDQAAPIVQKYTLALTDDERDSLFSLNEANKVFVEECLQEGQVNGGILPQPLQPLVKEMSKDLTLFNQLDQAESILNGWMIRIKDTKRLTAHEAFKVGLTIYTVYEALAKAGVPDAKASYDRLKERFAAQGGRPPQENP